MKKRDLKKQLISESRDFVPDLKNKVYASLSYQEKQPQKGSFGLKPAITALAILILSLFLFIEKAEITNSLVIIEINPSIQLEVNSENLVVSASALNTDGYFFLENLEINNLDLTAALDLIVEEAKLAGYLQTENSKIYAVAVNNNKKTEANVNKRIKKTIETNNPGIMSNDEEIKSEAKQYNISPGTMYIINQALEIDSNLKLEDALKMEVKDLVGIMDNKTRTKIDLYKDNLNEFDLKLENKLEEVEFARDNFKSSRKKLDDLLKIKDSEQLLSSLELEFPDYIASSKEYPLFLEELNKVENEREREKVLKDLFTDIEDFYGEYFDFMEELSRKEHKNHKEEYEKRVKINPGKKDDFSYDFDELFSYGEDINRYTELEKEVIMLISQIKAMFKNPHRETREEIAALYEEYEIIIEEVDPEFLKSEIIIRFEKEYQDYLNHHQGSHPKGPDGGKRPK